MQAGRLRHRITLQRLVAGSPQQKNTGEPDESWTDVAELWASVDPIIGREFFAAEQVQSRVDTKIRIRYRSGVAATMRVLASGVVYNIEAVLNVENRNRELVLMCSAGVNDG